MSFDSRPFVEFPRGAQFNPTSKTDFTGTSHRIVGDIAIATQNNTGLFASNHQNSDFTVGDIFIDANGKTFRVYNKVSDFPFSIDVVPDPVVQGSVNGPDPNLFTPGVLFKPSTKFRFKTAASLLTGSVIVSDGLRQSIQAAAMEELDEYFCNLENFSNVQPKPSSSGVALVYQGSTWVPTPVSSFSGTSTVVTTTPITGDGSIGDPVRLTDGTNKSQQLRFNGTVWNILDSSFDAIIASSGGDFTTIEAAIAKGCHRLAVITDVTQASLATLSKNTSIKIFHDVTVSNSPALPTAFDCNGFNLTIDGHGTIVWTADATAASSYSTDSAATMFKLQGVTFAMNDQDNKTISDQNQVYSDLNLILPAAANSGLLVPASRYAKMTNVTVTGGGAGSDTIIRNLGNLESTNIIIDGIGNGTTSVVSLEGNTNLSNVRVNQNGPNITTINGNSGSGSVNINGMIATGVGDVDVIMNNTGQFTMHNCEGVNDITMTSDRCKLTNCNNINSVTVSGNNAKISHYDGGDITVTGDGLRVSFADLASGNFTGTTNDTFLTHSTVGPVVIIGDRNKISECAATSISVDGDQNILNGNRTTNTITILPGGSNNLIGHNLTDTSIIVTGSIGTVQSGNSIF